MKPWNAKISAGYGLEKCCFHIIPYGAKSRLTILPQLQMMDVIPGSAIRTVGLMKSLEITKSSYVRSLRKSQIQLSI